MGSVTSEDARQYSERWKLVAELEITELRNTPIEIKARQLSALMASREPIPRGSGYGTRDTRGPGTLGSTPERAHWLSALQSRGRISSGGHSPLQKQLLQRSRNA
jgi:hypothetical protein